MNRKVEWVKVDYEGNFYNRMVGKIVKETDDTYVIEIPFPKTSPRVEFYKHQIKLF
jgi:hypothetical protein